MVDLCTGGLKLPQLCDPHTLGPRVGGNTDIFNGKPQPIITDIYSRSSLDKQQNTVFTHFCHTLSLKIDTTDWFAL